MPLTADALLRLPYASEVVPDATTDGGMTYLASNPELPGCMAHGTTPEDALQNLAGARELYIRTLVERGIEVPLPAGDSVTSV